MRYGDQDTDRLYSDQPEQDFGLEEQELIDQPEQDFDLEEQELIDQLPDDLDPHDMADSLPDEIVAEEGQDFGLDPDLAVFAAQDELEDEEEL